MRWVALLENVRRMCYIERNKYYSMSLTMAKTATINTRIEPDLKHEAEGIFGALGIKSSDAISMFYKQVVLQKGMPFDVRIPNEETLAAINESREGLPVYSDSRAMIGDILAESD